jgi:coenzyme F420-0:L-glutamate ligase / coenzyme F420-1:gamma-L-glutamate ligase
VTHELRIRPVLGIPELRSGDELGRVIADAGSPGDDEIVVISQKVVSKVEGRVRKLSEIEPGAEAREWAERLDKDPALVELVLAESERVVRAERGILITETRSGWICANAGIDTSNLPEGQVSLLPEDADGSARRIRSEIAAASGSSPAVVIADSFGRPWRMGQADIAIGCAGLAPLQDWRGQRDREGKELSATVIAVADELASAADLIREKDSGVPAVIVTGRGELVTRDDGPGAAELRRPPQDDLFR